MVEDKIIIHDKKINYLMFAIGFALYFTLISVVFTNSIFSNVFVNLFKDDYDFLKFYASFTYRAWLIISLISIPSTIVCFIFARKILINKKFTVLVFVLKLIEESILLINRMPWWTLPVNIVSVITNIILIAELVFILIILIKNNILSKLLLISIIFIGINTIVNIFMPYVRDYVLSLRFVSSYYYPVGEMMVVLNYVNFISKLINYAGYILVIVYIVKCLVKNNVFKLNKLNTLLAFVVMLAPALFCNFIMIVVYIISIFILTV